MRVIPSQPAAPVSTTNDMFEVALDQAGAAYQLQSPARVAIAGSLSVGVFIPGQATLGSATISACVIGTHGHTAG